MKKRIQNYHIEGIHLMSTIQVLITKGHKTFLILAMTLAVIAISGNDVLADDYNANDATSFKAAVDDARTSGVSPSTITLMGNIDFTAPYTMDLGGKSLTLNLSSFNIMGTQDLEVTGASGAKLTITGNTTGMNLGLNIRGLVTVDYDGTYVSASDDVFGKNTDNVTINFDINNPNPYSTWNATNRKITVGEAGTATFNVGAGNHVLSKDTVVGEIAGGNGTINIYHPGTYWKNTDNFIVGRAGTGALNLGLKGNDKWPEYHGAILETGNFIVGSGGGSGTVNITGTGTILNIFGTTVASPTASGTAIMLVDDRAQVYLTYNDVLDNGVSLKGNANLTLATGTSTFDNAYFNIDRGFIDGSSNAMSFVNRAMFEGSTYGITKSAPATWGLYGAYGKITLSSLNFGNGGLFSPGYGSSSLWGSNTPLDFSQNGMVNMYYLGKYADPFDDNGNRYVDAHGNPLPVSRYGQIDITGNFKLEQDGIAIFDFDIEGAEGHADPLAAKLEHKDYVNVTGTATLDGHVHFRPMTGYYQNDVKVQFMNASAGVPDAQLTQWPSRWFENPKITNGLLEMTRHQTPFNTSGVYFNEKSVGTALDVIYNERQAMNVGELMLTQEKDEWFPVLDWMWGMNDEDFRMAMRQLAGEARVSSFYMPLRSPWKYGFDRVNWRKRDNHVYFGQQNVHNATTAKNSLWVTPYYDYQHMSEDNNISGANISRVSFMSGYDRAIGKYSAIGFLFGYSQPKMDQGSSRVIADDYLFGLHGSTRIFSDYELKAWGSYGTQNYRLSRHVPIGNGKAVNADYSGNSWTGSLQLARPFNFSKGTIRPHIGVDYSYVDQSNATEDGYFPIALKYSESDWSQLYARAGIRGDFSWSRFAFTGSLSYSYLFEGDVTPTCTNQFLIGGPEFDIQGNDLSRSFVNVGLGTQVHLNRMKTRMLFVQYNGTYGDNMNSQNASLGYQMVF